METLNPKNKEHWPVTFKRGLPVDSTGHLPSGEPFADIRELKTLLKRDSERIARCLTEKLLTYGLGRGLGFSDREMVEAIVENVRGKHFGFRSLIQEVAASQAFIQP